MRLSRLCERAGVALPEGAEDVEVNAFAIDHRKVAPGTVFGAFEGYSVNGEDFIPQAIASGAIGVIARPPAKVEGAVHFADDKPRRLFARLAGAFFCPFPETIVAVTGTNGKTSTVEMTRQLWRMAGERAASIGTLGVTTPDESVSTGLTTPDIVTFLSNLRGLAREGTTHIAYEASSHGLSQYRNEGVPVKAAAFTNFSRDHLDYHATMEDYFEAKMRLVEKVLDDDGTAVIWADDPKADDVIARAKKRGLEVMTVGKTGEDIVLVSQVPTELGQEIVVRHAGIEKKIALPLIGAYQAANALTAAGLAVATGVSPSQALDGVARLQPVAGRLQRAAINRDGAPAYVDYAHTPDALEAAIAALRPHCKGELTVVFGAGGDRDQGKRKPMGEVAAKAADKVIVTDDNPRGEDPATIRAAILDGAPQAQEIGDRRAAIDAAISGAKRGDIVLIAGKGHEQGQIIGSGENAQVLAFDDVAVARECAGGAA
ncbi:UDP-N-acetylmuramoyl-L-alanyl-D-glutamate--2,6-diaminopimelate ligase [Pseudoblastomonas halimionae]|uniref:UDP-N-acetylmuramoyl-L-alanyl-D-glutamate--2,6-diaminopimelate ligase n=1 Tax=Alteriqipengyuania halimionae TaxID=1926630 RepID=A0A6I4U291_9SPHN|nr:UDP-N-acetylmuramoyl-L-alanyl-D-glutamate--2,6-diaminopimelate ligase [Alteriqipengyuania halimionae]MXP10130.1 UDP-N-acetylmuramoyl-L-alanyl-D-glutamate--2,6-diaminopimelate ligase [Alteriqipengyuania halimionae]